MARLAGRGARISMAEEGEKRFGRGAIEGKARRKLHENWAALGAEIACFVEEFCNRSVAIDQPLYVGNFPRRFHRKAEILRNRSSPAGECRRFMRTVKRRVDFDAVEDVGISLKA